MTHDEAQRLYRAEVQAREKSKRERQNIVDEFAKCIIGGIAAEYDWMRAKHSQYYQSDLETASAAAYDIAEAMMAEREKRLK